MVNYLAWILSATSAVMLWLMGNKNKWGPRLGLLNQVLWLAFCLALKQWGLLPGIIIYAIVHIRNMLQWEKM